MTPAENGRRLACYHEAGHAVAAAVLRHGLHHTMVEGLWAFDPDSDVFQTGETNSRTTSEARIRRDARGLRQVSGWVVCCLAGDESERLYRGRYAGSAAISDLLTSWSWLAWIHRCDPSMAPVKKGMVECRTRCRALLQQHWAAVEEVARQLEDRGRLTGREVREIVRKHREAP